MKYGVYVKLIQQTDLSAKLWQAISAVNEAEHTASNYRGPLQQQRSSIKRCTAISPNRLANRPWQSTSQ